MGQTSFSNGSGHKGINWDDQPLGQISDVRLSRIVGVTSSAVRKARLKRNIPTAFKNRWKGVDFGVRSDKELACDLGVSRRTISRTRQEKGLHGPQTINWNKQPLGELPDTELGRRLGVSQPVVSSVRRRRGIPAANRQWFTSEEEVGTWPEVIIDLYWHEKRVTHEFQVKVGPYVADWKVHGKTLVEYAGFGSHRKYGGPYLEHLKKKLRFYEKEGWETLVIWPKDLGKYDLGLFPKPRNLISCSGCQRTLGVDVGPLGGLVKHKAHGLCRSCYRKRKVLI